MKISKVNHMKTAVSVRDGAQEAILYADPSKGNDPIQDMKKVYEDLSANAAKLYSILNPAREKEEKRISSLHTKVNALIKELLKYWVKDDLQATVKKQLGFLTGDGILKYPPQNEAPTDEEIEMLVVQCLRKSLRINVTVNGERYYLPDIAVKFIIKLKECWEKKEKVVFNDDADPIGVQEAEAFLRAVVSDWEKLYKSPEKKEKIIRSLKNQKALVKVIHKNGRSLLVPSNSTHAKKAHVFAFMRAYAAGSEEDRRGMLIAMRTLLVIYLRGEGDFNSVKVAENSFLCEFSPEDFLDAGVSAALDRVSAIKSSQYKADGKQKKINEDKIHRIYTDIIPEIEKILKSHYRSTLEAVSENDFLIDEVCGDYCSDLLDGEEPKISALRFWLDYFDEEARKTLLQRRRLDTYKTGLLWLGKRLWSNWTSYIALKFIDYGKAVYHFVLPEEFKFDGEGLRLGDVLPDYEGGISSFEYERLKARDDLDRNTAVAVTFAVNTFSRAVLASTPMKWNDRKNQEEPVEDVLFAGRDVYYPHLYGDAGKRILRYFGGASNWENNDEIALYSSEDKGIEIIVPILEQLKDLRNSSFHYLAAEGSTDTGRIQILFDQEKDTYSELIRKKYFSNNVYRYYSEDDAKEFLGFVYREPAYVPAQIPAFQHLFNRNSAFMHDRIIKGDAKRKIAGSGTDELRIFKGTLFFLMKEIYYKAFLQDPGCKDRFMALVRGEDPNAAVKNEYALQNFRKRIETLGEDADLGEICQLVMTDYELQNKDKRVRNSRKNGREQYRHFRTLLYFFLREAFLDYFLKSEKAKIFAFIREPAIKENWKNKTLEGYLASWTCDTYKGILQDKSMLKWYALAHFLTPKHLNHLIGSYKQYGVFINSIERRAGNTGNRTDDVETLRKEGRRVKDIVDMLAFSACFCARTTNTAGDYFKDDEEYASVISDFVQLDKKYVDSDMTALKMLCDKELELSTGKKDKNGKKCKIKQRIGIYCDAYNPIVNRNVVLASMYGDLRMLSVICGRITEIDINQYYKRKEDLSEVFKKGACASIKEQEKLREFQDIKNRIELHDILTFTEMVSDLNGQLVNWSYFRERDLMYMQLGVQYTKLFFTDAVPKDDFRRKIVGERFAFTDGAILYQITATYDYRLPLYGFGGNGRGKVSVKAGVPISACVIGFVEKYCGEELEKKNTVYNEGLYFFENIDEHRELVDTRNYIDHFKYYANHERSLLDLYSEIYERFFDYSRNFKKSVSYILPNILERYFVVLKTEIEKGERRAWNGREYCYHDAAEIRIKEICSADFTYTFKEDGKDVRHQVPAHSRKFLETVKRILEYKA